MRAREETLGRVLESGGSAWRGTRWSIAKGWEGSCGSSAVEEGILERLSDEAVVCLG